MRIEKVPLSAMPEHFRPMPTALAARDPRIVNRFAFDYQDARQFIDHAKRAAARGLDFETSARLDPGPALDKLRNGGAAVVTGQQPGVLLGPLYNFYKAATAVKLSRWLESQGVPSVPVFWNHSDDDNPEGLDRVGFPDKIFTATWSGGAVLSTRQATIDLGDIWAASPHRAWLDSLPLRGSLAKNFSAILKALFGDELLILEPHQLGGKKVFQKALYDPSVIQDHLDAGAEALRSLVFEPALTGQYGANVYSIEGDKRVKVDKLPAQGRLSAGVALRLIHQDTVLPTAAYIAGPNEISYIAQLKELYEFFELGAPAVAPRISATLMEPRASRLVEKLELKLPDIFLGEEKLQKRQAMKAGGEVLGKLDKLVADFKAGVAALQPDLDRLQMGDLSKKTEEKISTVTSAFRERFVEASKKSDDVSGAQIQKLTAYVTPEGKLQERVFSLWHYVAQFGPEFPAILMGELDPLSNSHQVVFLDGKVEETKARSQ